MLISREIRCCNFPSSHSCCFCFNQRNRHGSIDWIIGSEIKFNKLEPSVVNAKYSQSVTPNKARKHPIGKGYPVLQEPPPLAGYCPD